MLKLGLTGSIATGKSTVLATFAALGVPTFSADAAVHALYEAEAVDPIGEVFPGVIHGGKVDRAALGAWLVDHPADIARLETIVHPLVRQAIGAFVAEATRKAARLVVIDIPLLFETGHDYGLDAVLVTTVDEATQRQRALARPGMTVEKLNTILARQLPQAEKRARATYVIETAGSMAQTEGLVRALYAQLLAAQDGNR